MLVQYLVRNFKIHEQNVNHRIKIDGPSLKITGQSLKITGQPLKMMALHQKLLNNTKNH
jgi:hypothetical protein